MTYKILFGLVDLDSINFFILNQTQHTRGHRYKLVSSHCRVDVRKYFFSQRVIAPWNSLPPEIIDFKNLNCFRRTLKEIDLSDFTRMRS